MFGIQAAGKMAQTINGQGHNISKRTKCKRRKLPRSNHYTNVKKTPPPKKKCTRTGTDRTHRNKIMQNEFPRSRQPSISVLPRSIASFERPLAKYPVIDSSLRICSFYTLFHYEAFYPSPLYLCAILPHNCV